MHMMTRGSGRGGVLLCLLLSAGAAGCSNADENSNGSAGAGAGAGAGPSAGSPAVAGGGAASGASGGATSGASGSDASDAGDSGDAGGAAAGDGGSATGVAGAAGTGGGSGAGGAANNCAGKAVSLSSNATGTAPDDALAQVVIDMNTDLPIGNANRTIEFWADIKPTDWVDGHNEMFMYGDVQAKSGVGAFGLDFGAFAVAGMPDNHATLDPFTGAAIDAGFSDDSRNYLGITSSIRQWVHIAMSWDGTAIKTYVNGALKITSTGNHGATALATENVFGFSLGCNWVRSGCFNGSYDELRIWNTARSDAEIAANYDTTVATDALGLVGYFKFDEADANGNSPDAVTTFGHTPHLATFTANGTLADYPTVITPSPPPPVRCR